MKKQQVSIGLFIISLGGLLWSRALLSASVGLWFLFILYHYKQLSIVIFKKNFILWGFAPVLMALLGVWQYPLDVKSWDLVLTLSVYPITAIVLHLLHYDASVFKKMILIWIFFACLAIGKPILFYLLHAKDALEKYGSGQSLPVFMDNDHVRFSIFLSAAALFAWFYRKINPLYLVTFFVLLISIIFLSVRTGWMLMIIMCVILVLESLIHPSKNKLRSSFIYVSILLVLILGAWFFFPTVQQKLAYTFYDWQNITDHSFNSTLSDGTRYAMNKSTWKLIQNGNVNIGWAAIETQVQQSFQQLYPGSNTSFGWPFNQWLFWWIGSGFIGMLLFSCWLFFPVFIGIKQKNTGLVCWSLAIAVSCLVEVTLAYQYGVWLHAWGIGLLWQYQQSQHKAST
jgi:hypothetical protein